MKRLTNQIPPYEGDQPYMYFAFAEADSAEARKLLRPLLARGCRVWYCVGPAGSTEELLRRQERASGAALTVVYLTDAACRDKDTKSAVLVNQKFNRPILCVDPDKNDRSLSMNLRETVPHVQLYQLTGNAEWENAVIHAEGFSQDMIGEPVKIKSDGSLAKKMILLFCALAVLLAALAFVRYQNLSRVQQEPPPDEVSFSDPAFQDAVRQAVGDDVITEERLRGITFLQFRGMPESWEELGLLPSLETIGLPQQALMAGGELPDGDYVIELSGGDGS